MAASAAHLVASRPPCAAAVAAAIAARLAPPRPLAAFPAPNRGGQAEPDCSPQPASRNSQPAPPRETNVCTPAARRAASQPQARQLDGGWHAVPTPPQPVLSAAPAPDGAGQPAGRSASLTPPTGSAAPCTLPSAPCPPTPETLPASGNRQPASPRETNFSPSPEQLHLLQALQNQDDVTSLKDFCEQNGVSRASLYRWQRNPAFRRWLAARVGEHLSFNSSILLVTASNAALAGDLRLQMAMLKFALNPNGLTAFAAYTQAAAAAPLPGDAPEPETPEEQASAASVPDTRHLAPGNLPELPPPAGAISATYRLLKQVRRASEADCRRARNALQFARDMEKLKVYAEREAAELASQRPCAASAQAAAGVGAMA